QNSILSMEATGKPKVTPLEEGKVFVTKQMESDSGKLLPKHRASVESVLIVTEGACTMKLPDSERPLKQGQSNVIPANVWHQVKAEPEFKAIHVMPKEIEFEFST